MKIKGLLLLILAFGSHAAWAQEEGQMLFLPTEEQKDIPFFDRNSWVSTALIGYYGPEDKDNRDIHMILVNIGGEHYVLKNFGIVADAYLVSTNGNIIHDDDSTMTVLESDSFGIGGSLGLKWHFLRGRLWSTFVNGAVGLLFTNKDFPAGGTSWNFMEHADIGFTFRLREQWHLIAAISKLHVSNGKGLNRSNPSFNGEGGYIGLVYRFDILRVLN